MTTTEQMSSIKTAMIIDDNECDRFAQQKLMIHTGFARNVIVKKSAIEALVYLNNIDNERPKVIFLDINMPVMDGYAFLASYSKLSSRIKKYCNIVILSSSINSADMDTMTNQPHVIRYLSKPLQLEDLTELNGQFQ